MVLDTVTQYAVRARRAPDGRSYGVPSTPDDVAFGVPTLRR